MTREISIPEIIKGVPKLPVIKPRLVPVDINKELENGLNLTSLDLNNVNENNNVNATVFSNRVLVENEHAKIFQLEFEFKNKVDYDFEPGQVYMITPPQFPSKIVQLMQVLNFQDHFYKFENQQQRISQWLSRKSFFPKKKVLRLMCEYLDGALKRKLMYLISLSGKADFKLLEHWDIIQWCVEFPCNIPFEYLYEVLDDLEPRRYSVCRARPQLLTFTFNRIPGGICSTWMSELKQGTDINLVKIDHKFNAQQGNILMIANGTGVVPFIAILDEIEKLYNTDRKVVLVYGHRNDSDCLYAKELERMEAKGFLTVKHVYSRKESMKKQYVQDVISDFQEYLFDWNVLVCGSGAMGKSLHSVLIELHQQKFHGDAASAIEYWNQQSVIGRYKRDLW
jgi:sulfite reductase alpha subunit-like flavoprotein